MKNICIPALALLLSTIAFSQAPNGESYVNSPFFDDFDGDTLNSTTWLVATWKEHGGQTGRDRCFVEDGILHLHFINSSSDGFLSSALQTRQEFLYGKWEMRAKPSSVSGVLNSFYTIDWDNTALDGSGSDGTKQEIDIEFLTKSFDGSGGEVHLALHEHGKTSWDTRPDIDLGFNPSADFHVYGFDITPEYIEWFADDRVLYRYEYDGNPISITAPYALKLNTWSAQRWIEGPPEPDVVCDYQIDWIKFTPSQAAPTKSNRIKRTGENHIRIDNKRLNILLPHRSLVLYNARGELVLDKRSHQVEPRVYDISSETSSGVHFYSIRTGDRKISGSLLVR